MRPHVVVVIAMAWAGLAHARVYVPPAAPEPPKEEPPPASKVKLLVLDLKANDLDPRTVATIQSIVTTRLSEYDELEVISGEDMRNMVQLEAERQSMGACTDASCMAELADALGADLVVFGNCGALDESKVLNLNLFDSKQARGLGRIVIQTETTDQMARQLRPKLHDLLGKFYKERGMTLPALPPEEPAPVAVQRDEGFDPGPWPWVAAGVGGVLVAAGAGAAVFGYLPLLTFNESKAAVQSAEAQFKKDEDVKHIEAAREAQGDMLAARDAWNSWGVIAFDGGIAAVAVGSALLIGGVTLGLFAGGDEPAEEPEEVPGNTHKHGKLVNRERTDDAGGAQ